jgi:NitT/TauT family transport system substrate-binding protein
MVANLKAVRQYNQGKTKRNLDILAKHTGLDRELLEEVCWPAIRNNGQIHIESVMDYQAWAMKKGFLDKEVAPNQFWDPRFIDYANKVLNSSKNNFDSSDEI